MTMPSNLHNYFELMAIATEGCPIGLGMSVMDFNSMMPWHLEMMLEFRKGVREQAKPKKNNDL